jgi:hypothetical protein
MSYSRPLLSWGLADAVLDKVSAEFGNIFEFSENILDAFLDENSLKFPRHHIFKKEKIQEILIFLIIKFSFDIFLHKNIFIIEKKIRRNFKT